MKSSTIMARALTAGLLIASSGYGTAQPAYPSKPIRLIVANPPGGGTSIMGRLVGQKLTESWGQPVILDNRPGGNGFIGGEALVKSAPDGHTITVVTSTYITSTLLFPAPYDPVKDFAAVAIIAKAELVLVVHPSVPASNLKAFIAYARSRPGQLNYGSSGAGAVTRLAGAFFDVMTGTKMQNISYKGTAQTITDLLGGQVQLSFSVLPPVIPHVLAGKLRAIAVSGEARLAALPNVPTFTEAGLPGFDVRTWYGFLAPAGTPTAILDKLSIEITRILTIPEIMEKIVSQGAEPFTSTRNEFAALIKADMARFAKVIKEANIKIE